MGNSFNNQFPTNPVGAQQNNTGARVPQRPYNNGTQRPQTASAPRNAANRGYRVPTRAPAAAAPASVQSSAPAAAAAAGLQSSVPRVAAPAKMQPPAAAGDTLLQENALSGVSANTKAASSDKGTSLSSDNTNSYKSNYSEDSLKLDFSEENLLRGLIISEILGKPKCLRRGRW